MSHSTMNISTGFNSSSTADDIVDTLDLRDKVIVITGTNTGLGKESARVLSAKGAYIIEIGRSSAAIGQSFIGCDFSDLNQVQSAIEEVIHLNKKIDVIICNAGIMALPHYESIDGLEKHFLVNHIAHFKLVTALLPYLQEDGRIVVVSSEAYRLALSQPILPLTMNATNYQPWRAYGISKLANILFTLALAQEFAGTKKSVMAVHPGTVNTRLWRNLPKWQGFVYRILAPLIGMKTPAQGAATQVFAAVHPAAADYNGTYLFNCKVRELDERVLSQNDPAAFWEFSKSLL